MNQNNNEFQLEKLALIASEYSIKKNLKEYLFKLFLILILIILSSYIISTLFFYINKEIKNKTILFEPSKREKKELSLEEKYFICMYLLEIEEKNIKDKKYFSEIISEKNIRKFIKKTGQNYYIACDFGEIGRKNSENIKSELIKKNIISDAYIHEPIYKLEF